MRLHLDGDRHATVRRLLTDEEIWTIIQYERSPSGGHGPA
jgi:hypothetical protein